MLIDLLHFGRVITLYLTSVNVEWCQSLVNVGLFLHVTHLVRVPKDNNPKRHVLTLRLSCNTTSPSTLGTFSQTFAHALCLSLHGLHKELTQWRGEDCLSISALFPATQLITHLWCDWCNSFDIMCLSVWVSVITLMAELTHTESWLLSLYSTLGVVYLGWSK